MCKRFFTWCGKDENELILLMMLMWMLGFVLGMFTGWVGTLATRHDRTRAPAAPRWVPAEPEQVLPEPGRGEGEDGDGDSARGHSLVVCGRQVSIEWIGRR